MNRLPVLFFAVVNFAILVGVLRYTLRTPTREYFQHRHLQIAERIAAIAQEERAAGERLNRAQEQRRNVDREVARIVESIAHVAEGERREILERAERSSQRIAQEGVQQMAQERARTLANIRHAVLAQAFALVEKELRSGALNARQRTIMDRSIEDLGALKKFGTPAGMGEMNGRAA